jgi:enolase
MGGWWPSFDSNEKAIEFVVRAIERAGFAPGEDIAIAIDMGASQLGRRGQYALIRDGKRYSSDPLIGVLLGWLRKYPIVMITDPLGDDDVPALSRFTMAAGAGVDTLLHAGAATDARRISALAVAAAGTGTVIVPSDVGTLTETSEAINAARAVGMSLMLSGRDNEGDSVALMHLAVGWGIERLRGGGLSRGERTAVWNEGLRIAEHGPCGPALPPRTRFRW